MRWIALAAVAALAATTTGAAEPEAAKVEANSPAVDIVAAMPPLPPPMLIPEPEAIVTVTVDPLQEAGTFRVATVDLIAAPNAAAEVSATVHALPGPLAAVALSPPAKRYSEIRPARGAASRKARKINNVLLSRTARHQLALLATAENDEALVAALLDNGDAESGGDAIDLQIFYQRPKVVKAAAAEDGPDVSDEVRLRLFIARMKAVEAHRLAHFADPSDGADEELPDAIKLRLFMARMKAVEAHRRSFTNTVPT